MNCSFTSENSSCDVVGSNTTLLPVDACTGDITDHLISLGISLKRGWRSTGASSEKDLILNKSGKFNLGPSETAVLSICPKHRRELTVDWPGRKRNVCGYPKHTGGTKQMKNPRRVNLAMSYQIYTRYGTVTPAGTGKKSL